MNPDDIPSTVKAVARGIAVGRLEEMYSGQLPSTAARDLADHVIAYTWSAIEAHIREQVAQALDVDHDAPDTPDMYRLGLRRASRAARRA